MNPLRKPKQLHFERTYPAPINRVWEAWTDPELIQQWWGPDKTIVTDCEVDLRVGGELRIVTEATSEMGKYAGTRWPMVATFLEVEQPERLVYDATSCTEGDEAGSTIHHTNDVTLRSVDADTVLTLKVNITQIGPKAKMAAFGMKWGYKSQLDKLKELLA